MSREVDERVVHRRSAGRSRVAGKDVFVVVRDGRSGREGSFCVMDIKPVSASERNLNGLDYFLLWAGIAISLAEIWAGGFLAPMGLWLGLLAIILGHVIGNTFMALGGVVGSEYGLMSMVSARPSFGILGSSFGALLNIIQLIGWSAIMLIICAQAGSILGSSSGGLLASRHFWIIVSGLGTLLWALYTGQPIWKKLQTVSVIGLLLVIILMTWVTFKDLGTQIVVPRNGSLPFMIGLDLVIAMPISFLPSVADYSRFSKGTKSAFWNTWWGYFIISSWMYGLGLMATLVTGETDPGLLILKTMKAIGFAIPALLMVALATVTSNFITVYSAACSALNMSDRLNSKVIMWIIGLTAIAAALVFPVDQYEGFLFFIGAMFVPLYGVILTDYFILRQRKLDLDEISRVNGEYWYYKGFNVVAFISWAVGFFVFEFIAVMKYPLGGSMPSIAVAGLLYYGITVWRRKKAVQPGLASPVASQME